MAIDFLTCKCRKALIQMLHLLIFLAVMALVFHLTFNVLGEALRELLTQGIGKVTIAVNKLLISVDAPYLLHSLIMEGIFPGVGSVLSFVPIIGVLFFFLSLLEESGYLSYVGTLLDKPMSRLGLTGRSVVPLISGFGCNVPAIMTAGTLLKGREKRTVISMMSFMSCSARLPIYSIFITAFFEKRRLLVLAAVYGMGIAVAILMALLKKKSINHGVTSNAKIVQRFDDRDVPSETLRCPKSHCENHHTSSALVASILRTVWQNCTGFVKKACTVVLLASVIIWFLRTFGVGLTPVDDIDDSILAALGKMAVPLFEPLGFGDWRASSALISGLFAKETIISTLTMLSTSGSGSAAYVAVFSGSSSTLLTGSFSSLSAFCFMVFCLLYIPCIPTLAAIRKETGSIRFCIALCLFQLVTAWLVSFLLFQGGGYYKEAAML